MAIADPAQAYDHNSYVQPPGKFPGWMKPTTGKWELRDMYLLDLKWLRSLGPYCYSHRVFYVDSETWGRPLISEAYDNNGKFWKSNWVVNVPIDFRGQHTLIEPASFSAVMAIDFQNGHATETVETPATVDEAVPDEFKDIEVMASPGGLARIMK